MDMPVPVSNYQIAALTDSTGLGFYVIGGRDDPGNIVTTGLGFYVIGGRDDPGNIVTTVQVYYPATNTTAVIGTDPWPGKTRPVASPSRPRE
jgi:hypothetical protein